MSDMFGTPPLYVNKDWLAKFPAGKDVVDLLRLGLTVIVTDAPQEDGIAYLGFYPEQLPEGCQKYALPLVGDEVECFHRVLLHFLLGYIPTEVAAFKGEQSDIVSRVRLQ